MLLKNTSCFQQTTEAFFERAGWAKGESNGTDEIFSVLCQKKKKSGRAVMIAKKLSEVTVYREAQYEGYNWQGSTEVQKGQKGPAYLDGICNQRYHRGL